MKKSPLMQHAQEQLCDVPNGLQSVVRYSYARITNPKVLAKALRNLALSKREMQVAVMALHGLSYTQMAEVLGLHPMTLDTYLSRVCTRLRVDCRRRLCTKIILASGLLVPDHDYNTVESCTETPTPG